MNKLIIRRTNLKNSFNKTTKNTKLTALGYKYAKLMQYESIGKGKWRSMRGFESSSLEIGKKLYGLGFINKKGTDLNISEIRRVNCGCPLNSIRQISLGV